MKKLILTVLTICAFVLTNAQEKANHNTTRSNKTSGIMVKEDLKDDDCDGILAINMFKELPKGTKPTTGLHLFTSNGKTYYYTGDINKLNKCKKQQSSLKCGNSAPTGCILTSSCFILCPLENDRDTLKPLPNPDIGLISDGNSNSGNNTSIINEAKKKKNKAKTKLKKRNKNFNRKGERVKRTKF